MLLPRVSYLFRKVDQIRTGCKVPPFLVQLPCKLVVVPAVKVPAVGKIAIDVQGSRGRVTRGFREIISSKCNGTTTRTKQSAGSFSNGNIIKSEKLRNHLASGITSIKYNSIGAGCKVPVESNHVAICDCSCDKYTVFGIREDASSIDIHCCRRQ